MALKLKTTSPLAARVATCVVMDGDAAVDLCGGTVTLNPGVTLGEGEWAGVARKFFSTGGSGYSPYGAVLSGNRSIDTTNGTCLFVALAGAGAGSNAKVIAGLGGTNNGLVKSNGGVLCFNGGTGIAASPQGTTVLPSNGTTAFSVAGNYQSNVISAPFFGLRGAPIALEGPAGNPGGFNPGGRLLTLGGVSGQGFFPGKYLAAVHLEGMLTLAELQTLHENWYGELVDQDAPLATKVVRVTEIVPGAIGQVVRGTVFEAPALSDATGPELVRFTGKTIVAHDTGAGFDLDAAELGLEQLPTGANLRVIWESDTWASSGTHLATVLEI